MSTDFIVPTFNLDFMKVTGFEVDVVGAAIEGGRNLMGESISILMTGGGIVKASYDCLIGDPEQYEYVNWLGARCNGSHRYINVPIRTDFAGPFQKIGGRPAPFITGIPHSDGSLFSDDSGYSQSTVWGRLRAPAGVNAGQLDIEVVGATRNIRWSDWFAIYHETKGWRAYRTWEQSDPVDTTVVLPGHSYPAKRYTVAISPTLRETSSTFTRIEFARPRFVAKFPSDFTLPFKSDLNNMDRPTIRFTEAF